jgi:hypothetical protein
VSGQTPAQARPADAPSAEPAESDFLAFISTLAMQALMAMGEIPHPQTHQRHEDLVQAQYLIDSLEMLSQKTQGNLSPEEEKEMKNLLYQLKMKFVRKEQGLPQ